MGLLDALKQYVSDSMPGGLLNPEWNKTNGQRLAEELNRGLLESTGINARDKRRVWNKEKLDAVSGSSDTKASLNQQAYDSAMAMAGMAPMGLTVWHGSPHKFSKFDMSKIGTGEGAQAYGHGLYMAENPEVAKSYSPVKPGGYSIEGGSPYKPDGGYEQAMLNLVSQYGSAQKALDAMGPKVPETIKQTLIEMANKGVKVDPASHTALYKVDIPDEAVARMLDWDKPLSQQAPEVQKAVMPYFGKNTDLSNYTVADIVKSLSPEDQLSMAKQGIPGIRYLDGGSRAGGQGTSNYVLFSDQLPRILEVNGKPTGQTPWSAGEWQGLLSQ